MNRRALLILALVATALAPMHIVGAQSPEALVDLPAAMLRPADAEAAGLTGFGRFGNGHQRQFDEYTQQRADFQRKPVEELRAALTDAGWLQGYSVELGLPDQPGAQEAQPTEVLFSSSYQYDSPAGASSALALLTDYSGVTAAAVDTTVVGPAIGDEFVWSRTTSATVDPEGPSDEVAVVFRVGDVLAAVGDIDYSVTDEQVATPTAVDPMRVELVAALAKHVAERLVDTSAAPGLPALVTRLGSDAAMPAITDEGYRRIDGVDIPYFNGFADDFPGLAGAATNAYEYSAALDQFGGDPYDPYFALRVYQFPDEASASAFLNQTQATMAGSPEAALPIGDEFVLIPESFEIAPGVTVNGWIALVRVGGRVSQVLFESADHKPDPAIVLELATVQANCMASGVCPAQPIPIDW